MVSAVGDNHHWRNYRAAMERGQPFIRLKLDVDQPIDLGEFVAAFTAMGAEYERFIKTERPDATSNSTLYVKHVRDGCIEAELIPWIIGGGLLTALGAANTVYDFVEKYGGRISKYLKAGGRAEGASKSELNHFSEQVAAIANTPGSNLQIAAIEVENGKEITRVAFKFDTSEARTIQQRVDEHKREIEHQSRADRERVLMIFIRSDVRDAAVGKRSGELVEIAAISPKPRPLIYASAIAEEQIKFEITTDDSVYKKGFVVDVNVEMRGGKPVAYAVTNLHQVIDLPDDAET